MLSHRGMICSHSLYSHTECVFISMLEHIISMLKHISCLTVLSPRSTCKEQLAPHPLGNLGASLPQLPGTGTDRPSVRQWRSNQRGEGHWLDKVIFSLRGATIHSRAVDRGREIRPKDNTEEPTRHGGSSPKRAD